MNLCLKAFMGLDRESGISLNHYKMVKNFQLEKLGSLHTFPFQMFQSISSLTIKFLIYQSFISIISQYRHQSETKGFKMAKNSCVDFCFSRKQLLFLLRQSLKALQSVFILSLFSGFIMLQSTLKELFFRLRVFLSAFRLLNSVLNNFSLSISVYLC